MLLTKSLSLGTTIIYWIAQLLGALTGAFFCFMILGEINSPMVTDQNLHWVLADLAGEALGTFSFVLIILI